MQALHDAILEALFSGGVLSEEALQQLLGEPADGDQEQARQHLEDLVQQIIERMMEQGFITGAPDLDKEREHRRGHGRRRGRGCRPGDLRGHRQGARLPRLPGAERSARLVAEAAPAATTRIISATGVEASAAPKPYEFGDTLNLDPSSTILNAVLRLRPEDAKPARRRRIRGSSRLRRSDGRAERYQSSCATVMMLDCSHSMILYGEDRSRRPSASRWRWRT